MHNQSLKLGVDLNGLTLHNPITVASGTFGFGREYSEYIDLNQIGAISVKGLTLEPRSGNEGIRIVETSMGMLNSVGLQNPGVHAFIKKEIPFLRQYQTKIIANINGNNIEEYCEMAQILSNEDVDSLELNISCPNVKNGGLAFGTNPEVVKEVVSKVRKHAKKHLIVKLSPNVTDIKAIAKIVEEEGADCIALINTLSGMAIDIYKRKPVLNRISGGLSGPAVKPVALRMVYEVAQTVKIPVLGMGGISNTTDAVEFLLAGATALAIGTANFANPKVTAEILNGIETYMRTYQYDDINQLIGDLR
ncbi:MAG: dihydroorotate dehydrogenase catalytic subunit [Clostridiales bacterium]|jgi:dihydroorotate dehydrogenase (NAD+) catalytic subunit|nr:dihydroorotate dehydrogenase catalytic subunit [Clostridiales bacterium]